MREVLAELTTALGAGRPCVYCAVVETRGSTPQKAGAAMLVFADGGQKGTLGGGCVEAEVRQQALRLLHESGGRPGLLTFCLDDNYGWDDGLICGGRMPILADPRPSAARDYYRRHRDLLEQGRGCTEAVVLGKGVGPSVGTRYLFDAAGALAAQTAAGAVPEVVVRLLPPLARRPGPSAQQGVAYLPVLPRVTLL